MIRNHLFLTLIHICIPFLQVLALFDPTIPFRSLRNSPIPSLIIPHQAPSPGTSSQSPVVLWCGFCLQLIGLKSNSTLHLAPVCDLDTDFNLQYSLSLLFSPLVPPAWEPDPGQLYLSPLSFLPLTYAHCLGPHLRLLHSALI